MTPKGIQFAVVDASLWIARLVPQDGFHDRVSAWMGTFRARGGEFLAPALLLPETAGAISRRTGQRELAVRATEQLENLPGLRLIDMDADLLRTAARLAARLGLRGADATYVAVAARLRIPLATLDDDQRNRAAGQIALVDLRVF